MHHIEGSVKPKCLSFQISWDLQTSTVHPKDYTNDGMAQILLYHFGLAQCLEDNLC